MARSRSARLALAVLVVVGVSSSGTASGYDEVPRFGPNCFSWSADGSDIVNFRYHFVNSGSYTWTQARRDQVAAAIDGWEEVRNVTGEPLTVSNSTGSTSVAIYFSDDALGNADSQCIINPSPVRQIRINSDYYNNMGSLLDSTVQHEVGHMLRLDHTGRYAPQEGGRGVMSICHSSYSTRTITSDENAGVSLHFDGRNGAPNGGFERSDYAWAPQSLSVTHQSTGGRTGPRRVRLLRTGEFGAYKSAVMISGPNTQRIGVEGYVQRASSTQTSAAGIQLWWARVEYSSTVFNCGDSSTFSSGTDESTYKAPGPMTFYGDDATGPTSSGWIGLNTGGIDVSGKTGIAVVVLIPNFLNSNGSYGYVYYDDIEIKVY